jgi:hypothetical protein
MDSFCAPAQSARKVTIGRFLGLIGVIPNDEVKDLMLNCVPRKGVYFAF